MLYNANYPANQQHPQYVMFHQVKKPSKIFLILGAIAAFLSFILFAILILAPDGSISDYVKSVFILGWLVATCMAYALFVLYIILYISAKKNEKKLATQAKAAQEAAYAAELRRQWSEKQAQEQAARERQIKQYISDAIDAIPQIDIKPEQIIPRGEASAAESIKQSIITAKTDFCALFPLVSIDIETTGLAPYKDDIIEVSAIKYDIGMTPVSRFSTLLKPRNGKSIPAETVAVHHITDDMVTDKPTFGEVGAALQRYIKGCNIVGHNLHGFDMRFLSKGGIVFDPKKKYFDTLDLAKKVLKLNESDKFNARTGQYIYNSGDVDNYKLPTLCEHYGILYDAHRSDADAFVTAILFSKLIKDKTGIDIIDANTYMQK